MFDTVQTVSGGVATWLFGVAVGAAWVAAIVAPNCSYDRLDASRADGHVRQLILAASTPISGLLAAAAAFAMLSASPGAAVLAAIAAFGFFSNRWTLAPKRKGEAPPGVRTRRKSQRIVAVSLSLIFSAVAGVGGLLAIFGV